MGTYFGTPDCPGEATEKSFESSSELLNVVDFHQKSVSSLIQLQGERTAVYGGGGESEEYEAKRDTITWQMDVSWIDEICRDRIIFTGLDKEQRAAVIQQMHKVECRKGDTIIKEGDTTQEFFLVEKGSFDIHVKNEWIAEVTKGQSFGELSMLYDAPRTATVIAKEDSTIYAVSRHAFRSVLRNQQMNKVSMIKAVLKKVEIFSSLDERKVNDLEMAFERCDFEEGETIIKQGEEGDKFYLIISGRCGWTKKLTSGAVEKGDLLLHDFFGERALITKEKRAATIIAKSKVKTLVLLKEDFNAIIGEEPIFVKHLTRYDSEMKLNSQLEVCSLKLLKENTIGILGAGAFGTVTLVLDTAEDKSYALKAVNKSRIVKMGMQKRVIAEMKVMRQLATYQNPFLVNLVRTFKDELRVYYLLEACLGGELFTILRDKSCFSEKVARFYVACVIDAFDCMHSHDIIYRDLKPENLVLDHNGWAKLTDFGFAKVVTEVTYTLCGTPDYLAPEMVSGQGHNRAVDWWTLGVLTYEMLASYPPFFCNSPMETNRKILKGKVRYDRLFSEPAKRFVASFLRLKPVKRLGMQPGGVEKIKNRSFFSDFDWEMWQTRTMTPPFRNKVDSPKDMSNFKVAKLKMDDAKPVRKDADFDSDF